MKIALKRPFRSVQIERDHGGALHLARGVVVEVDSDTLALIRSTRPDVFSAIEIVDGPPKSKRVSRLLDDANPTFVLPVVEEKPKPRKRKR